MRLIKTGAVFLLIAALLVSGIPVAFADSPPTVQTLKPTRMYLYYAGAGAPGGGWMTEDVRARLNGSVNPGGRSCTVYFEYGTTTAYGSTASAGAASGASAVSVSADLTGLRTNTLYHYRLVAVMGNLQIVASPSDGTYWAVFDIYNHNNFDVELNYDASASASGSIVIGRQQNTQIFVPKGSVCAFSYNYSLFKQIVTNDQIPAETPQPQNNIELYSLGYLNEGSAAVYSINNRNGYPVTLELQSGNARPSVTVPAFANVYFVVAEPGAHELMASYGGNPFAVVSQSLMQWYGAALVTAEPKGTGDTTATFELQNNDDAAHSVKLKNAGGVTHAYTLAPYEHQTITIEKSDWNLYAAFPLTSAQYSGLGGGRLCEN